MDGVGRGVDEQELLLGPEREPELAAEAAAAARVL